MARPPARTGHIYTAIVCYCCRRIQWNCCVCPHFAYSHPPRPATSILISGVLVLSVGPFLLLLGLSSSSRRCPPRASSTLACAPPEPLNPPGLSLVPVALARPPHSSLACVDTPHGRPPKNHIVHHHRRHTYAHTLNKHSDSGAPIAAALPLASVRPSLSSLLLVAPLACSIPASPKGSTCPIRREQPAAPDSVPLARLGALPFAATRARPQAADSSSCPAAAKGSAPDRGREAEPCSASFRRPGFCLLSPPSSAVQPTPLPLPLPLPLPSDPRAIGAAPAPHSPASPRPPRRPFHKERPAAVVASTARQTQRERRNPNLESVIALRRPDKDKTRSASTPHTHRSASFLSPHRRLTPPSPPSRLPRNHSSARRRRSLLRSCRHCPPPHEATAARAQPNPPSSAAGHWPPPLLHRFCFCTASASASALRQPRKRRYVSPVRPPSVPRPSVPRPSSARPPPVPRPSPVRPPSAAPVL